MGDMADFALEEVMDDFDEIQERAFDEAYREMRNPWIYINNVDVYTRHNNPDYMAFAKETQKPYHGTVGKYLFFSADREALEYLGEKILKEHNLFVAKVSKKPNNTGTHVLCVYDISNRLCDKLKTYQTDKIAFRYWKSDRKTIEQFEATQGGANDGDAHEDWGCRD